jgi:hypothetical protein
LLTNSNALSNLNGGDADITFRCLSKGDPALQRPSYQHSPNIVIEHR